MRVTPYPGLRCWAIHTVGYPLPEGLASRTPLVFIALLGQPGPDHFRVRDASRRYWHLSRHNLDSGYLYNLGGRLLHENHPLSAAYVRTLLAEQQAALTADNFQGDARHACIHQISRLTWFLERSGYDPLDKLPTGHPIPPHTIPQPKYERPARPTTWKRTR